MACGLRRVLPKTVELKGKLTQRLAQQVCSCFPGSTASASHWPQSPAHGSTSQTSLHRRITTPLENQLTHRRYSSAGGSMGSDLTLQNYWKPSPTLHTPLDVLH